MKQLSRLTVFHNSRGLWMITLSAVCFGSYGIWNRLMGGQFGEFSQATLRGLLLVLLLLPVLLAKKLWHPIQAKDWRWFLAVALTGGLNQAPIFIAFQQLSVGMATFLFYAGLTLAGYIVGWLGFGEKLDSVKWISFGLAMIGVALLFGLSIDSSNWFGGVMAILAGLMGGVEVSFTKKISGTYSSIQIMLLLFVAMVIGNGILAILFKEVLPLQFALPAVKTAWLSLIAYALALVIAMAAVVEGYKTTEASLGSIVGLSEVVFAAIFGLLVFGEQLSMVQLAGGVLVTLSAAMPVLFQKKT